MAAQAKFVFTLSVGGTKPGITPSRLEKRIQRASVPTR